MQYKYKGNNKDGKLSIVWNVFSLQSLCYFLLLLLVILKQLPAIQWREAIINNNNTIVYYHALHLRVTGIIHIYV